MMTPSSPLSPIVCGTDFSENATFAATAAAVLARLSGRPLLLVHATDEFNVRGRDPDELTAFLLPIKMQLQDEAGRLRLMGATVETQMLTGELAQRAVLKAVEQQPVSLLVLSSVSKTAFERWSLGSTTEYLARSVPAPTLVVRSSAPFVAWGSGERPLKVLVAVNFSNVSEAPLEWVRELRALGPCEIVIAYLNQPAEDCARLGISVPTSGNPQEVEQVLERELADVVHARLGDQNVRIIIAAVSGPSDARLIQIAVEEHADLVVVGTRQRQGLQRLWHAASISLGILRHAPMSVVSVPAVSIADENMSIPVIQRVLVATDGSDTGNHAVRQACSLLPEGGQADPPACHRAAPRHRRL
jgi:nucleotide-binding universal stress UspA family protein